MNKLKKNTQPGRVNFLIILIHFFFINIVVSAAILENSENLEGQFIEIKVLDKFDNIFVIGLNPQEHIRIKYIKEVRKYIIPMTEIVLPELSEAFEYACSMGEKGGYISK